jgi:small-conductance mechanosensitive channel
MGKLDELFNHVGGRPASEWLLAIAVGVGTMVVLRLIKAFVRAHLAALAQRTESNLDDILVKIVDRTYWFSYLAAGLWAGSSTLDLTLRQQDLIGKIVTVTLLLQGGLWLQTGIRRGAVTWGRRHDAGREQQTFALAIGLLLRILMWSILFLVALGSLGIEITPLVASLGIGGIAAALAVQATLGDLISSFSIYFDRPFDIGDFIVVDDFMGTVQSIGLRTTRVASLGGEQLVFPNSNLTSSRIRNYGRMERRRVAFKVGVEYSSSYAQLEAIPRHVRAIVEAQSDTTFDRSHFSGYGDSSLDFETVYYVLSADYNRFMDIQQAIYLAIFKKFQDEGIGFAFPTRTLYMASTPAVRPTSTAPAHRFNAES